MPILDTGFRILDEEKDNGPRSATTATGPLSPAAFFIVPKNHVNTLQLAVDAADFWHELRSDPERYQILVHW